MPFVQVARVSNNAMKHLLEEIRHNPLLWLLAFVPVVLTAEKLAPKSAHGGVYGGGVVSPRRPQTTVCRPVFERRRRAIQIEPIGIKRLSQGGRRHAGRSKIR
jgi:hypothetical protein